MGNYGQYNPDNTIKQEADVCILTGRFVDPKNSVRERIKDTPYFYRVIDSQYDRVTDEMRKEWSANVPKVEVPAAPESTPVGAMSFETPTGSGASADAAPLIQGDNTDEATNPVKKKGGF